MCFSSQRSCAYNFQQRNTTTRERLHLAVRFCSASIFVRFLQCVGHPTSLVVSSPDRMLQGRCVSQDVWSHGYFVRRTPSHRSTSRNALCNVRGALGGDRLVGSVGASRLVLAQDLMLASTYHGPQQKVQEPTDASHRPIFSVQGQSPLYPLSGRFLGHTVHSDRPVAQRRDRDAGQE